MKFTFAPESKPLDGYTIKRAIHRGGFGEVYYALSDAGKEVALKLLNNNLEVELRGVSQCLNLKHPNLVTIFDIRTDSDGDHWIVMEYVAGDCLDKVAARYPDGMPMEQIQKWLSGMAAGIAFLHDRGIVHRDLKPANIFSDATGVKVGDVGLSKFISESRRSAQTQSVGTVYYMAPEVARGRYGREVDIYAMGIILYELITGRVPFEGQTTAEILMKHLSEHPDLSLLPERLRPVVARALEKDPDRRISDPLELEREFRAAVLGVSRPMPPQPPQAPQPPPLPPGNSTGARPGSSRAERADLRQTVMARPAPHVPQPTGFMTWFTSLSPFAQCAMGGIGFVLLTRMGLFSGALPEIIIPGVMLGAVVWGVFSIWRAVFRPDESTEAASQLPRGDQPTQRGTPPGARYAEHRPGNPAKARPVKARPAKAKPAPAFRRAKVVKPRPLSPATPRSISSRQRMRELTGSMTLAVLCTAVITALLTLTEVLRDGNRIAMFAIVTLAASWAIMATAKLVEGRRLGSMSRRMLTAAAGATVGLLAWNLNGLLLADIPISDGGSPLFDRRDLLENGQASAMLFAVYFAALFFVRRWWWHTDSLRSGRFRISTTLVTMLAAAAVAGFSGFNIEWGVMWALAISAVVQLASAWAPTEQRFPTARQATVKE